MAVSLQVRPMAVASFFLLRAFAGIRVSVALATAASIGRLRSVGKGSARGASISVRAARTGVSDTTVTTVNQFAPFDEFSAFFPNRQTQIQNQTFRGLEKNNDTIFDIKMKSPDENRKHTLFSQDSFFLLSSCFLCDGFISFFVEFLLTLTALNLGCASEKFK